MNALPMIYRCKYMLDVKKCIIVENIAIWVEDGKISAITSPDQIPADFPGEIVDFGNKVIMPGLIDAHVHLFGSEKPGAFRDSEMETEAFLLLRACENARKALAVGITTVRDCGARATITQELRKAVSDGMVPGPRILSSGMPITTTGGHCYYLGLEADGVQGAQKAVRLMHKQSVDFIKVMVTGGGITAGSNSRRSQFNLAELKAIVADAHRLGKRVAGHVHGTEGIDWASEAGFDTLEHCSWLAAEGEERDYQPAIADRIIKKGIYVCRSIAGFERVKLEEATPDHKFWKDYAVLRNMAQAGVKLIAGTDSGIDYTPIDGLVYSLETMVGLGKVPVSQVVQSTTITAAEGIGIADLVGSLEPGKIADMIVVDKNPLQNISTLRHVRTVIQAGKVVF